MPKAGRVFDLFLSYPQWQGSGRSEHLPRGALALAELFGGTMPEARVPLSDRGDDGSGVNRFEAILEHMASAQGILSRLSPSTVLTAGGDCAVDIAVIDYLSGRYPDLTVIWIDSHFDANTPRSSPSGNLHGMPVAAIMGAAPVGMGARLRHPISPSRFRYVWAHVADDGDRDFQVEHDLCWLGDDEIVSGPIHVHFDLDVLDPKEFPHLAYPESDGMPVARAAALLGRLGRDGDVVGLTITEFAPACPEDAETGVRTVSACTLPWARAWVSHPLGRPRRSSRYFSIGNSCWRDGSDRAGVGRPRCIDVPARTVGSRAVRRPTRAPAFCLQSWHARSSSPSRDGTTLPFAARGSSFTDQACRIRAGSGTIAAGDSRKIVSPVKGVPMKPTILVAFAAVCGGLAIAAPAQAQRHGGGGGFRAGGLGGGGFHGGGGYGGGFHGGGGGFRAGGGGFHGGGFGRPAVGFREGRYDGGYGGYGGYRTGYGGWHGGGRGWGYGHGWHHHYRGYYGYGGRCRTFWHYHHLVRRCW